jgi:hypothetical protein
VGECRCFRAGEVVRLSGVAITRQRHNVAVPDIIGDGASEPAVGEPGQAAVQDT